MGASSDQLEQQIAEVRGSMESKIIELRERSRTQVRRISRTLMIAVGVGAAVGVAVVGGLIVYRLTRPPTTRERIERVIPKGVLKDLRRVRQTLVRNTRIESPIRNAPIHDRRMDFGSWHRCSICRAIRWRTQHIVRQGDASGHCCSSLTGDAGSRSAALIRAFA